MLPLRKILCPTDFSDPSYKAVRVAQEWASHFDAELILVHVITPVPTYTAPGFTGAEEAMSRQGIADYMAEVEAGAKNLLDALLANVVPDTVTSRSVILHGNPADKIVDYAEEGSVDIIITATHGRTGFRRLIFGSVAERVLRHARCPVLIIPAHPEEE